MQRSQTATTTSETASGVSSLAEAGAARHDKPMGSCMIWIAFVLERFVPWLGTRPTRMMSGNLVGGIWLDRR